MGTISIEMNLPSWVEQTDSLANRFVESKDPYLFEHLQKIGCTADEPQAFCVR